MTQATMLAATRLGPEQLGLTEVAMPVAAPDEVLIRIRACAICASDLLGWRSLEERPATPGKWNFNNPGLTGHEIAGDIVAIGANVSPERLHERVWVDPVTGCGACESCARGEQTFCAATTVVCQGFAEFTTAPARQCMPIPDGFDYAKASLIGDMVGTPFGAMKRAGLSQGESVAVWGLGPVGLGLVQAARIGGAGTIVGIDPVASRRALAETLGATRTIDPSGDVVDRVREALDGAGADVVLCSVGNADAARLAFQSLRLGGRMVTVAGFPPAGGDTPKWVTGSWACDNKHWDEVLTVLDARTFDLDAYVSHTFPLEEIDAAFALRAEDLERSLKVVIENGPAE